MSTNVIAVIRRELCVQSRSPSTYWLRVCAALLVSIAFAALASRQPAAGPTSGAHLLVSLHFVLLAGIWIFGSAITADCLSCEKREGTLGLLFLTPLTA